MPEITREQMVELLKEIRSGLRDVIEIKDMDYLLHYFWRSDIPIIDTILAALAEPSEEERKGLVEHFDKHISFVIGGKDACPTCVKIRDLINQNFHLYLLVFFLSEENKKKTR